MASRIVVFPVIGRRWAFTTVPSAPGTQSGLGNSPQVMSVTELLNTLRATPRPSDQAELLVSFASDKMNQQFTAWEAAPEGSVRNRLHRIGHGMLSRLGPTESFLKAIPKDAEVVEIIYPNGVDARLVRRRVRHLATSGEVIHQRYMYGSMALLPFSMILGILPLPNVVLAWNLFRAYSHWRALQGSRRLQYLVTDSPSEGPSSQPKTEEQNGTVSDGARGADDESGGTQVFEKWEKAEEANRWVLLPSEILETLLTASVPKEAISDVTVDEICKEYPVDPNEIVKWRDQKLQIRSFG